MASRRTLITIVLLSFACGHPPVDSVAPVAVPGRWKATIPADYRVEYGVLVRKSADSAERQWYGGYQEEARREENGRAIIIGTQGAKTFGWDDTVRMDARTLAPIREHLLLAHQRIDIVYDGRRVTRTIQKGDSLPVTLSQSFATPVYAFNQVDLLMRAVPFRAGTTMILPLYSEIDADLERDTLQVIAGPLRGQHDWTVRFADPSIVTVATIDPATRQFTSYEVRPRKSSGVSRRAP